MRPVSAFQATPQTVSSTVDRALLAQFVAAHDEERAALVTAHPEILSTAFREGLSIIGNQLDKDDDAVGAERHYRAALFIGRRYHFPATEATALNNIGILLGSRGNLQAARGYFDDAFAVASAANDTATIQSSLNNIAVQQRRIGDLDGALATHARSIEIARGFSDRSALAKALNNVGVVYYNLGNGARALEYYVESLAIKEALAINPSEVVNTLTNIGAVYSEQGDFALALEYYRRAVNLAEQAGAPPSVMTTALNNMGHAHLVLGEYAAARKELEQSLALAEKGGQLVRVTTALYNLANLARAEGRIDQAEALQRRNLALREQGEDRIGLIESLTELANLLARHDRAAEGLAFGERAVAMAEGTHLFNQQWKAQMSLGYVHQVLGHETEARTNYQLAIDTIERLRQMAAGGERARQRFLSDRMGPFYKMADLHANAGRPFDALAVIDRARGRTLTDIIASGRPVMRRADAQERADEDKVSQALADAVKQLEAEVRLPKPNAQRIAVLERGLEKARLARDAFIGELYARQPDMSFARGNTPDLTRERLAEVLRDDEAIVTFMIDERQAWTYVVTPGAKGPVVTAQRLAMPTPELVDLAKLYSRQLATRDLGFASTARQLYDALLSKADPLIAGARHVTIIPDGPLWQMPFQALQTPRGRFLIEEHAVSYAPSITAWAALEARSRAHASTAPFLVAVGDPAITSPATATAKSGDTLRGIPAGRLPEAAREVKAIGRLYGADHSAVLVADDATETALRDRLDRATVVHVATHGVLDDKNPMYSHLMLAPTPKASGADHTTDGRLEAWELLDLGINAKLAVLSACQTAGGSRFGEGVIGLSWSLFAAGASTAVVSQWEVDSASTTSLMIAFHEQLLKPGATVTSPEALRQAALTLLKNPAYRHPFYWAGFISVGAK